MKSSENPRAARRIELQRNAFVRLGGPRTQRLRVLCGVAWLTLDGEPDDHLLQRGDERVLPPHAHALVQALDAPAQFLVREAPGRLGAWWQALRGLWHPLRRVAAPHAGTP